MAEEAIGSSATYGKLLEVFVQAGNTECAEALCEVIKKKCEQSKLSIYPWVPIIRTIAAAVCAVEGFPVRCMHGKGLASTAIHGCFRSIEHVETYRHTPQNF